MRKELAIIIPVFNNKSIEDTLESVKMVKTDEIEIIVIDGGSTDGTVEVISKYKNMIDVFVSEQDQGIHDAINKGIGLADSEWIFVLAADDKLLCDPLKMIFKYGKNNCDLLCGHVIGISKDGKFSIMKSEQDLSLLEFECSLRHPATFFKKHVYDCYGKYDNSIKRAGDRDMFLRLYKQGVKIYIMNEFITLFYTGGISAQKPTKYAFREDILISDRYHVNKIKSRLFFINRCLHYWGGQVKTKLGLEHKTIHLLNKNELCEEIKKYNNISTEFLELL